MRFVPNSLTMALRTLVAASSGNDDPLIGETTGRPLQASILAFNRETLRIDEAIAIRDHIRKSGSQ